MDRWEYQQIRWMVAGTQELNAWAAGGWRVVPGVLKEDMWLLMERQITEPEEETDEPYVG